MATATSTFLIGGQGSPEAREAALSRKALEKRRFAHVCHRARERFGLRLQWRDWMRIIRSIEAHGVRGERQFYPVEFVAAKPLAHPRHYPRSYWYVYMAGHMLPVVYEAHEHGGMLVTVLKFFSDT